MIRRERTLTAAASPATDPSQPTVPVLLLVGRAGGPAPGSPERVAFVGDELVLGRRAQGSVGELVLDDALVSGRHARLARAGGGFILRDEGSKNGTFLDGRAVVGEVALRGGARLHLGHHAFVFRVATPHEVEAIREELQEPLGPVATASPALAAICRRLRRLARTDQEILLAGETGVGKEVYARAVHARSGRRGRFVPLNCAAIPRELVESEIFGYRPGAHSTAQGAKPGLIEEAEGGTLFLDELGEMSSEVQSKLLRFLQDRQLLPLGGTRPRAVDVRVVAATNRPLLAGKPEGLRDDLFARLGAGSFVLPPLRERAEDIGALAAHFAAARGGEARFDVPAFRALTLHDYPLNVRELEKILGAALTMAAGRAITLADLPERLGHAAARPAAGPPGGGPAVPVAPEVRRKRPEPAPRPAELERLLAEHKGNVADVSRALGRQRAAVWRWIKQFGLGPDKYRDDD